MTSLSRSGRTDAGGKLTSRVDVPLSEELEAAIIVLATIEGVPKAEFSRRILEEAIFGKLTMVRRIARHHVACPSDECRNEGGRT